MLSRAENIIQRLYKLSASKASFNQVFFDHLKFQGIEDDQLLFKLDILQEHCSRFGYIHTGGLASLVDACTTVSAWVANDEDKLSLSINLHMIYHHYPKAGETILIKAKCLDLLPERAMTAATVENRGKIIALGSQDVFFMQERIPTF